MTTIRYSIDIFLLRLFKWWVVNTYGTCDELDGQRFNAEGRCAGCDAAEVVKWIDNQIDFIRWCKGD